MSTTTTPNLGLVLESTLTPIARKNLQRIDSLGATFLLDSQQNTIVRSRGNILIVPNEASAGGSGTGGVVQFGTPNQPLEYLMFHANTVSLGSGVVLSDAATGGTRLLTLRYNSTISGPVETAQDLTFTIDVDGGNRALRLSSDLHIEGGEVRLTGPANVILPSSGTLVNRDSAENLTNKTLDTLRLQAGLFKYTVQTPSIIADRNLVLPPTPGTIGQILTKGTGDTTEWTDPPGTQALNTTWTAAQGNTLTIVHNWNTQYVHVEILDNENNYATVEINDVLRPNSNVVQLVSNSAPQSAWTVMLKGN